MAITESLNRRLRARRDEDEDEDVSSAESSSHNGPLQEDSDVESDDIDADSDEEMGEDSQSVSSTDNREALQSEFRQISFGALAKAQDSIGRKRKRGDAQQARAAAESASAADDDASKTINDIREKIRLAREQKRKQQNDDENDHNDRKKFTKITKPTSRSSKHAPTVQSSKVAVSRKRIVVEPPSVAKARDPRFDPTVASSSSSRHKNSSSATENAYSFLDEYRASELKQLQDQLRRTKDPALKEKLQRAITSATDRQRALDNRRREREVMSEHKKKERQLIREGKKSQPYYLKKSELKREVLKKKYEGMGSRERAKALERRRKKVASKEKKDLPWARRGVEQ